MIKEMEEFIMTEFMMAHPVLFTFQVGFVSLVLGTAISCIGRQGDTNHHHHYPNNIGGQNGETNRNNLCSYYWTLYDGASSLSDIQECTPAETIVREFRTLVASGRIILEAEVKEALQEKETEYLMEAIQG
jgi:hypothetical protein